MGGIPLLAVAEQKDFEKINSLLKSIQREPFTGEGKPEPLKDSPEEEWSRRLNEKDRLVYTVSDENIVITQCKGTIMTNEKE